MTPFIRAIAAFVFLCASLNAAWCQAPQLQTSKSTFAPFESIVVNWSNLSFGGKATLGVGIAKAGEKNTNLGTTKWIYDRTDNEGTRSFDGLLPGDYEVRIFTKTPDGMGEIPILRRAFAVRESSGQAEPRAIFVQLKLPAQNSTPPSPAAAVSRSGIGKLAFVQPTSPSSDPYLVERAQKVASLAGSDCARTEAYSWPVERAEQSKVDRIVKGMTRAATLRGYETKAVDVDLPNTTVIKATALNGTEPEANLLIVWGIEPGSLNLMLCLVDPHA